MSEDDTDKPLLDYREIEKEIDNQINQVLSIVQEYDPIDLLTALSLKVSFVYADSYTGVDDSKEYYLEYALSIALSQERKSQYKEYSDEIFTKFFDLIESIFRNLALYFTFEPSKGSNNRSEKDARLITLFDYIFVRGDSVDDHHIEMVSKIFNGHEEFFKSKYQFTPNQVINSYLEIKHQIIDNARKLSQQNHELEKINKELDESFTKFKQECGNSADVYEKFTCQANIKEKMEYANSLVNEINQCIFMLKPSDRLPIAILEQISLTFGSNRIFVKFEKAIGWPTTDSLIYTKPFIKEDNKYYCFSPLLFLRNICNILETLLFNVATEDYKTKFFKTRSVYLEDTSIKYLSVLLPGAESYKNLRYTLEINGKKIQAETDGLILYDENIFIIEAKSGAFNKYAKRGSIKSIRKCVDGIINEAFNQGMRTKKYIEQTDTPTFYSFDGTKILTLNEKTKYKNIYLINVTLENTGKLSSHLSTLKDLNYIQGSGHFWAVFINDLRIISEFLESPSEFLLYLDRRMRVDDFPEFHTHDEMDIFMYFLETGLYFDSGELKGYIKKSNSVFLFGYTDVLNQYYFFKNGNGPNRDKPRLKIPDEYRELIKSIESDKKFGFTQITKFLVGLDSGTIRDILKYINQIVSKFMDDGNKHDFSLAFEKFKKGISFVVGRDIYSRKENFLRFYQIKKYELKFDQWTVIFINYDSNNNKSTYYDELDYPWNHDIVMDRVVKNYEPYKHGKFIRRKRVGRNEKCPCGSGLKYKRCCGSDFK